MMSNICDSRFKIWIWNLISVGGNGGWKEKLEMD